MEGLVFSNEELLVKETLLSTANGYIGIRGNVEEGYPKDYQTIRGTYINGFYDEVDIKYGESAYGFPKKAQKIVNVMDAQSIVLDFDGERFSLFSGCVVKCKRYLDIENGIAVRKIFWESPSGKKVKICFKRMTSFVRLELAVINIEITPINFSGRLKVESNICAKTSNYVNPDDPRVSSEHGNLLNLQEMTIEKDLLLLRAKTNRSGLEVCCTVGHDFPCETMLDEKDQEVRANASLELEAGNPLVLTKYIAYTDSVRHESIKERGIQILREAQSVGNDILYSEQRHYLDAFWKHAKIEISDHSTIEESLNYSLYQLLSSAGKDMHANISAKGLSGEGYEGHYFWDTEIYMIPFFTLTNPKIARNLLKFRYATLFQAKKRAQEMGHHQGAKIPWRTISGNECSAYFPAGSAQYHINADVAYAYIQYYLLYDDLDLMWEFGFEVLVETGRIWLDMGHYHEGKFMIHAVTGPDEYSAIVNNNYYTNSMAKYHLEHTVKISKRLKETNIEKYEQLAMRLLLNNNEISQMKRAVECMYLPYDDKLGIYLQDDSFINKPIWDFKGTPKDNYPLLLHYHPLTIYRHQVLKQADTLLSMLLLDDVDTETIRRSYDYYEPLTTHDSSLSPCVYSMLASRINRVQSAYDFFMKTVRLDLDNLHHNTKDGLHIANAGGAYMAVVYGFGGLRIKEDGIHLKPVLPKEIEKIMFRFINRDTNVTIILTDRIIIQTDKRVKLFVYEKAYVIQDYQEVDFIDKD